MTAYDVVVFGAGYAGSRVVDGARQRGLVALGVVRGEESAARLRASGCLVTTEAVEVVAERDVAGAHAVVTFPPDGATDARLAPLLKTARAVSYLSTTGVYEDQEGLVDDTTPLPTEASPKYAKVRAAEAAYRAIGAAVLRAPGIYGHERGLHLRLQRGEFKLSGDGSRWSSRIHVEDLAALLLASATAPGETFVVGDLEPCPQRELVAWLCEHYGLPFPASAPLSEVHETLRRNRRIDPTRALKLLKATLRYPTYRSSLSSSTNH